MAERSQHVSVSIVISTHLDDAVWSAAGLCEDATVATICAGVPDLDEPPSPFDRDSGFDTGREAMLARRCEDCEAASLVGFEPYHYDVLDAAYGGRTDVDGIRTAVYLALADAGAECVAGPVGISHPDHIAVSDAFREAVATFGLDGWLYEDLPYARLRKDELNTRLHGAERAFTGKRLPLKRKREAVEAYTSQIRKDTHLKEILMTEHYHKIR